ncbi:MAG TPA: hypothetical protein VFS24_17375, partial [Steroidobacteraceae bacterium]|nr:hypothetical protein [Steroidobacteraceae bacterium]
MLAYSVQGDISQIERHLSGMARDQVPFATVLALTRTAKFAERKIKEEIPRVFDRPTPFTKNATYVQPATKQRRYAMVYIREQEKGRVAPIRYLQPQIYGGARGRKSFEKRLIESGKMPPNTYAVAATAADLDQYGNIKGGQITKILSDLQAQFDETQNTTARSRQRRLRSRRRRASFYFSTWPPSPKTAHLKPGIYLRSHFGFGTAIKPVLIFVRRVRYR